ncbi:zinc finger protein ENHYDROUS-like [Brassica napus]|uniref:C2H2-type domain-containing protein n=1 Tax=Brassica campestris TaxID=3711 RepID=M4ESP0_BRACM|nr:zinc finger protein ENHYDROUS-like [Brassica napus]
MPPVDLDNSSGDARSVSRNLPGMPDPEAEVIALSPKTLMAKNRFVCEICNKGFQRDQNLRLHRRGPKQTTLDFLGLGRAVGNGSSNPGGGLSALFGTAGEFSGKDIGRTSS